MKEGEDHDLKLSLSLPAAEIHSPRTSASGRGVDEKMRKKLRLTKQQAAVLEEAFKQRHLLTPKEKAALAEELDLRPRQVEVWLQNRRARKKLKKTEVDYEMLKRCCENLSIENQRLHREIVELRALKWQSRTPPLPTTLLSFCPSCERAIASFPNTIADQVTAHGSTSN